LTSVRKAWKCWKGFRFRFEHEYRELHRTVCLDQHSGQACLTGIEAAQS
jgi:hypothetical protein